MDLNWLTLRGTCGVSWIVEVQKQTKTSFYILEILAGKKKYFYQNNIFYFNFVILVFLNLLNWF